MASTRKAVSMSAAEAASFLAHSRRAAAVATLGQDGSAHLVPLWYVVRDGDPWLWTYARSQKVRNLERDDRLTLMVEEGERYDQLRGVTLECRAVIARDYDSVFSVGAEIYRKHIGSELSAAVVEMVRNQSKKRVAIHCATQHTSSWDHRKL